MSYNNTREDDDKDDQIRNVDQTQNSNLLDGEARKDSNESNDGDPEFMWFKKWKRKEVKIENDKEEGKETE